MAKYVAQRLFWIVPTLLGVSIVIFLIMRILPGDVAYVILGAEGGHFTPEDVAKVHAALGLDRPLSVQYLAWLVDIVRGNLGHSFWRDEPISQLIFERGAVTAQIALMAVVISWLIGLPLGLLSAAKQDSRIDRIAQVGSILGLALPSFWLGTLILLVLMTGFNWFPPLRFVSPWENAWHNLQQTGVPAVVLGLFLAAYAARMTRSAALEILRQDFVRTARAKGLRERVVMSRHVLKNALLPVVALSGVQLGALLSASVAVEKVFKVPGLGQTLVEAITERDYMVIQNLALTYAAAFAVLNLAVDLLNAWLDPRIADV
jgi:peptide/nickel transport system permease protein